MIEDTREKLLCAIGTVAGSIRSNTMPDIAKEKAEATLYLADALRSIDFYNREKRAPNPNIEAPELKGSNSK